MSSPLGGIRAVVSDLDGVVHRGDVAIPDAVEALNAAAAGRNVVYTTNNASRPPREVADRLEALGLGPAPLRVVTSAMAGARLLARVLRERGLNGTVLAVGGPGVATALQAEGLATVTCCDDAAPPVAVMQGYGPQTPWSAFAEASYAIERGAVWCLTNEDRTIPTARGLAPGNGMGGAAVAAATGIEPLVAGKPHGEIYELAIARAEAQAGETLAIGDRLDTDIAGANRLGMPTAWVLTGVHDLPDAAAAEPENRPEYVLGTLAQLGEEYAAPVLAGETVTCGGAAARLAGKQLSLRGGTGIERARAALQLVWHLRDAGSIDAGQAADLVRRSCPPGEGCA